METPNLTVSDESFTRCTKHVIPADIVILAQKEIGTTEEFATALSF